jgi:uncharacterized protein involved in exopolysaccharide biosynthesis
MQTLVWPLVPMLIKALGTGRDGPLWIPWRYRGLIARTTAVVWVFATAISLLLPHTYRATTSILLQPSFSNFMALSNNSIAADPERAVQTEIQVVLSQQVKDVARRQAQDASPITVVPSGRTDVIVITALSANRSRVANVANAYANAYILVRRNMVTGDLQAAQGQLASKIGTLQQQIDAAAQTDAARRDALINQQSVMQQRLDQIQVDAAVIATAGVVLSRATQPGLDSAGPVRNAVVSLLLGLVTGVILALTRDRWSLKRSAKNQSSDLSSDTGSGRTEVPVL